MILRFEALPSGHPDPSLHGVSIAYNGFLSQSIPLNWNPSGGDGLPISVVLSNGKGPDSPLKSNSVWVEAPQSPANSRRLTVMAPDWVEVKKTRHPDNRLGWPFRLARKTPGFTEGLALVRNDQDGWARALHIMVDPIPRSPWLLDSQGN
jgi:hypothetical protein